MKFREREREKERTHIVKGVWVPEKWKVIPYTLCSYVFMNINTPFSVDS